MEENRAWDVGASATAIGQEVRKNSKYFDKPIPRIPLSRNAPDTGWRWSYTATLVPTRWIFISPSFFCTDLTHLQVDAEIEVAGENENEKGSKDLETQVSKWPSADIIITLKVLV